MAEEANEIIAGTTPKESEEQREVTISEDEPEVANQETNKTDSIDYAKELVNEIEKFDQAERNRLGYMKRKRDTGEVETAEDLDAKAEEALERAAQKYIPKLQSTLVEDNIESILNELSPNNSAKQKLIKFHFENSVGLNGTLRERLENALLIADKKTILKTNKEMAVALQNRQGLSTTGQGTNTEEVEVKDSLLSKDQINDLKARGWNDQKIQRFKDNLRKQK